MTPNDNSIVQSNLMQVNDNAVNLVNISTGHINRNQETDAKIRNAKPLLESSIPILNEIVKTCQDWENSKDIMNGGVDSQSSGLQNRINDLQTRINEILGMIEVDRWNMNLVGIGGTI